MVLEGHVRPCIRPFLNGISLYTFPYPKLSVRKKWPQFNWSLRSYPYYLQLNLHQTNLLFRYLSHHLTWHCSSIYEDLHRYARKIVFVIVECLKLFRNNNKNNCASISVQICANLHKSWNNTMSNDGLIIETMDLSHIHLAVCMCILQWLKIVSFPLSKN